MKRRLGIKLCASSENKAEEMLKLIKETGFESFAVEYTDKDEIKRIKETSDSFGLFLECIYAPKRRLREMWNRGLNYLSVSRTMKSAIDTAAELGVKTVVINATKGKEIYPMNELGVSRFDEIVLYAEEKNVSIALENECLAGHTVYLGDRYKNLENFGLCYDAGHEHCYTNPLKWLDIFHNNVLVAVINDNMGRDGDKKPENDTHSLPFDGNIDYSEIMSKLNRNKYEGALILDVSKIGHEEMSDEEFFALAYERLKRISEIE